MKRGLFYRLFPPPLFLSAPAAGLDISDASVRCVLLEETLRGLEIAKFGKYALTPGVVEGGVIKDPEALRMILKTIHRIHGITRVAVSLPEEQGYLVYITVPPMLEAEIRGFLELGLEEYIPLKAQDAVFDFEIKSRTLEGFEVVLSAVPRTLVDMYVRAFEDTGIAPVSFEVEAHAISRAAVPHSERRTVMVVDFGKTRTGISVVSEGEVVFTSTILLGGESVTTMVSKELSVPMEKAELLKRSDEEISPRDREQVTLAVRTSVSVFRDEINKHVMYWNTHADDSGKEHRPIEHIYLCGGDANVRDLVKYLAPGLPVSVSLANSFANMDGFEHSIPPIAFGDSLGYTTALGLALRSHAAVLS